MAPRAYYRTPCKVEVHDMLLKTSSRLLTLGITLILVAATVQAQETVYKWVDKDGIVHFSETPPAESESVEVETLTTAKPPLYVPPPVQPADQPSAPPDMVPEKQSTGPKTGIPPPVAKIDIATMTLAELDRRCETARETMIAPLREAEIAKCKEQENSDPARCERFYADYGDGGKTPSGTIRPPLFHDLPECVESLQERRRRASLSPADHR